MQYQELQNLIDPNSDRSMTLGASFPFAKIPTSKGDVAVDKECRGRVFDFVQFVNMLYSRKCVDAGASSLEMSELEAVCE